MYLRMGQLMDAPCIAPSRVTQKIDANSCPETAYLFAFLLIYQNSPAYVNSLYLP